jgi:hypothetical protein
MPDSANVVVPAPYVSSFSGNTAAYESKGGNKRKTKSRKVKKNKSVSIWKRLTKFFSGKK